jgi:fatty acid desaturase
MVTSLLKISVRIAVAAAAAWAAFQGGAMLLLAAVLVLLYVVLFSLSVRSGSRSGDDVLHDSTISTLVFPPDSRIHRPPR